MKSYLTIKLQVKGKDVGFSECSSLTYFSDYKDFLDPSKTFYCPEKLDFELDGGNSLNFNVMKCTNQNKLLPQSKFCKGNPDSYVNKVKIENFELYRKNGKIYKNSNFKVVLESNKMTHVKTSL